MKSPIQRIDFDPSNSIHRRVYEHFLRHGQWAQHFNLPEPWRELPAYINRVMLLWYMEKENKQTQS